MSVVSTTPVPELEAFMRSEWDHAAACITLRQKVLGASFYRQRRQLLANAFPEHMLIVACGTEKVRNHDTHYPFRADSNFYYLTGCQLPGSVLVLNKGQKATLFVEESYRPQDAGYFSDRQRGGIWVGPSLSVTQNRLFYDVEQTLPRSALMDFIAAAVCPVRMVRGVDAAVEAWVQEKHRPQQSQWDTELLQYLHHMRLCKDRFEIHQLQKACRATKRCFTAVAERLRTAQYEYELEAALLGAAKAQNLQLGYPAIVASGSHACVLHWTRNDGRINANDSVLVDAGVESSGLYTADITRCLPKSGRFTPELRRIYQCVLDAHRAACAAIAPGQDFLAIHRAATEVLHAGLQRLGIPQHRPLPVHPSLYQRYTLHGTSHMLGLDVHDCGHATNERYRAGTLQPGMVLTVEPGLYFQPFDLTVPTPLRGLGVRLEDDVLVTPQGHALLSHLPLAPEDVEDWLHDVWRPLQPKR